MWTALIDFLNDSQAIIATASLLLWLIYVIITLKTHLEIKRQRKSGIVLDVIEVDCINKMNQPVRETEVQNANPVMHPKNVAVSEARKHLLFELEETRNSNKMNCPAIEISDLHDIFEQHFNHFGIPIRRKCLVFKLENVGNAHVLWFEIKISVKIDPGAYLTKKKISVARCDWIITSEDMIRPNRKLELIVAETGCFPYAEFSWQIEYRDITGRSTDFIGITSYEVRNNAALDFNLQPTFPKIGAIDKHVS